MIEGIPIRDLTPPTLLAVVFLMAMLGLIVPRFVYNEKKEEAEKWRLAYEAEKATRITSDAQTAQLLELAKTTHKIIAATFETTERLRSGGSDAISTT